MKLSLVIPAYNEEKIIEETVRTCAAYLESTYPADWELVVVSDGSTDATDDILGRLKAEYPRLVTPGYAQNRGKGCAVKTGMLAAQGDCVVFTDADLAYGTGIVGEIAARLAETGSDAVIGSRAIARDGYAGYTPLRKFMSKTYLLIVRLLTGFPWSDSQSGIKCFTRDAAQTVFSRLTLDGFSFDLEALTIAACHSMRVAEQPAVIINHRDSKVSPLRDAKRMLHDLRIIRRNRRAGLYDR